MLSDRPRGERLVAALLLVGALVWGTGAFGRDRPAGAPPAAALAPGTAGPEASHSGSTGDPEASEELDLFAAVVLGLVEGVTEYLPVSSTGHLHVTQRLLGVGETAETEDAADTYAITIQAGAILAVLLLYRSRMRDMARGAAGRSPAGRRVLGAVIVAFAPAAVVGLLLGDQIKDHLLSTGPIVAAWLAGGLAMLVLVPGLRRRARAHLELDSMTIRQALAIGALQVLALWPGTSRSLVTILAGLAVGLTVAAAVEFSFLLGLLTLGVATAYEALRNGADLIGVFGWLNPIVGFVAAFVSAIVAVRWMVAYLERRSLAIFGWYRIAAAGCGLLLLATGAV